MSDREQLEAFRRELSAVMPADFKDWHENDPAEWPMLAAQVIRDLRSERDELAADAERLNWLEARINRDGEIHLHDGAHAHGTGLGLRPGTMNRTLRQAIDTARGMP